MKNLISKHSRVSDFDVHKNKNWLYDFKPYGTGNKKDLELNIEYYKSVQTLKVNVMSVSKQDYVILRLNVLYVGLWERKLIFV